MQPNASQANRSVSTAHQGLIAPSARFLLSLCHTKNSNSRSVLNLEQDFITWNKFM